MHFPQSENLPLPFGCLFRIKFTAGEGSTGSLHALLFNSLADSLLRTEIRQKWRMLDSLQKERFEDSKTGTGPWAVIRTSEAISRNRYTNIYPWAENRIKLGVPEGKCDYINASPIILDHGEQGDKRYIATQVYSLFSSAISLKS